MEDREEERDRAQRRGKPVTAVLVHGAFADTASWNHVASRLRDRGQDVVAAPIRLWSLEADSHLVRGIVSSIEGPVVLVGHSYGGAVITAAGQMNDQVKSLVYVAGFAPAVGESIAELANRAPGSSLAETLWASQLPDGSNDLYIGRDRYHEQFAADLSDEEAALMAAGQRPLRDAALVDRLEGAPAWMTIPSWFVIPELDRNIPVETHRFMAERAGARSVLEVAGASHALPVSRPEEVTDTVLLAVEHAVAPAAATAFAR